jgi:hypothetical protein
MGGMSSDNSKLVTRQRMVSDWQLNNQTSVAFGSCASTYLNNCRIAAAHTNEERSTIFFQVHQLSYLGLLDIVPVHETLSRLGLIAELVQIAEFRLVQALQQSIMPFCFFQSRYMVRIVVFSPFVLLSTCTLHSTCKISFSSDRSSSFCEQNFLKGLLMRTECAREDEGSYTCTVSLRPTDRCGK